MRVFELNVSLMPPSGFTVILPPTQRVGREEPGVGRSETPGQGNEATGTLEGCQRRVLESQTHQTSPDAKGRRNRFRILDGLVPNTALFS